MSSEATIKRGASLSKIVDILFNIDTGVVELGEQLSSEVAFRDSGNRIKSHFYVVCLLLESFSMLIYWTSLLDGSDLIHCCRVF